MTDIIRAHALIPLLSSELFERLLNWFEVSPHWLRHCHGSHAIDRKAPLTVVRDTLGYSNIGRD